MAKIHLDRLEKKYGKDILKGKKYKDLMEKIIAQNSENISTRIATLNAKHWEGQNRRITKKEKRFVMPDIREALPSDAIHIRKAAERSQLLSDELRGSLTKNLRDTLHKFTPKTDQPAYVRRTGVTAGNINPDLIKEFEPKVNSWELIPSDGGRFEVKVDDKVVYSKLQTGRHTDSGELRQLLKAAL